MTFQDLRSGCCSTLRTPTTQKLVKTLKLQAQCFFATNNCCRDLTPSSLFHSAPHLTSRFGSEPNAMKASVPKLFNCPGATRLFLTPSQEIGWLVIAASRDRLKNLQHRGIAPVWSRKSPQTHQGFRLQRFGLRNSLSAPAQSKNITQGLPTLQPCPAYQASKESVKSAKR